MHILFIVPRYPKAEDHTTLEKDLTRIFADNGHQCSVVTMLEAKHKEKTYLSEDNGINVLRAKTGDFFDTVGRFQKGLTILKMPFQLLKAIRKYYPRKNIDVIIAYSPVMSDPFLVSQLKKGHGAKVLLMQWDIFPQNAIDLGLMKNSVMIGFFQRKFRKMLQLADGIIVNTPGTEDFLRENHLRLVQKKPFLLVRNCEAKGAIENVDSARLWSNVCQEHKICCTNTLCVFGGNMGIPQKLENIAALSNKLNCSDITFLFIGQGTEFNKLRLRFSNQKNLVFINSVPRQQYELIISNCDVGIVSLNERFKVPNFPMKVTGYLKLGLPILASLDNCSYADLGSYINSNKVGLAFRYNDIDKQIEAIKKFLQNKEKLKKMSAYSLALFKRDFNINDAYKNIIKLVRNI